MSNEPIPVETLPRSQSQQPPPNQLPAVVPAAQKSQVTQLERPTLRGQYVSNYRPEHPDEMVSFSRAIAPSDARLDVYVGKTILIKGVVINMAEFERGDGSGEIDEKPYMSIVLADDTVIGTTGKACVDQLLLLIRGATNGEINPPAEFEVRRHKSVPPKQDYYSLRRVRPLPYATRKAVQK